VEGDTAVDATLFEGGVGRSIRAEISKDIKVTIMKLSETFEGDNSSMKKTFEEVVYEATPFSPGVLTVGGPAQKEEAGEEYDELPSSFYRAPSHRDDCEGLVGGDIGLPCTCTTQKEEWVEEYDSMFHEYGFTICRSPYNPTMKDFIRSQISLAETRGREEEKVKWTEACLDAYAQGQSDAMGWDEFKERKCREATITAFEEWADNNRRYFDKSLGEPVLGVILHELVAFADLLKSNAPKV